MARLSTEAEYRALANTSSKLIWLESPLIEPHINYLSSPLLYDNLNAVMLSHNPIIDARIKHIELDIYFVQEIVVADKL